jgi:hypothetical protein
MIWKLRAGDVIRMSESVFHYDVIEVKRNNVTIKNQLTNESKKVKLSFIKDICHIIRRND